MMNKYQVAILLLVGCVASFTAALLMPVPGFMDAEYYYSGGVRLFSGQGFTENFLWNYLDNPGLLPHPAFTYWMPLPSLLAALGMWISGSSDFFSARLFFVLIAALIPLAAYFTSFTFSKSSRIAFLSGLLSAFPVFYGIHLTNTETFSLYIIFGCLFINLAFYSGNIFGITGYKKWLILGCLSGFLHLTRADGFLWLLAALLIGGIEGISSLQLSKNGLFKVGLSILCVLTGYFIVMFPWYFRNWSIFGSLFPTGNSQTIWLTYYDQIFKFPASELSYNNWINSGWKLLLIARWEALIANLQTLIAVQGEVFLFPLILLGLWKYRQDNRIRFSIIMWGVIFILMTIVFPFAGLRGGYLHSGSAFQIFFWVMASTGLEDVINFGVNKRKWNPEQAWRMFSSFFVILSILLTIFIYYQRVLGINPRQPVWRNSWDNHRQIETTIHDYGAAPGTIIMINNPPGYFAATSKPAIVIPDGNEKTIILVAEKFHADFLVLEKNHVKGLTELYNNPRSKPGLLYLGSVNQIQIYKFSQIQ
jgi:hypothetical protein